MPQLQWKAVTDPSGRITSLSPLTSTTVFSSSFCGPLRGDARVGAGAHLHVIGPGDLDLLEVADLIIARHGRARILAGVMPARAGRGGSGDDCRGDGFAHDSFLHPVHRI